MVFRAVVADIDKKRDGEKGGEAVHQGEAPEADAASDAGHDVYGRAQARQKAGEEDEAAAVAVKEGLGLNHPLWCQQFRKPARLAQMRAKSPATEVHHPVAAEDAEVRNHQHDVDVLLA